MTSSSTTNLGSGNMNLPQMRSIWLDEDEEAEKLYGLQAQQFMGSDDEENLGITFINSDKPVLSNKQNIELPPLLPNTHSSRYDGRSTSNSAVSIETSSSSSTIKTKHKKVLFKLNLLKKRFLGTQLDIRAKNISTPFDFQHISHADTKNGFQDEQLQGPLSAPTEIEEDSALSLSKRDSRSLNKAFVTERIPANRESKLIPRSHDKKTSRLSVRDRSQLLRLITLKAHRETTILSMAESFPHLPWRHPSLSILLTHRQSNPRPSRIT